MGMFGNCLIKHRMGKWALCLLFLFAAMGAFTLGAEAALVTDLQLDHGAIALTPAFQQGTTNYSANVGNSVTSVTVTVSGDTTFDASVNRGPVQQVSNALPQDFQVNGLAVGANSIAVSADNGLGVTETYTLTITRAAGGGDPNIPVTGFVVKPHVMSLDLADKNRGAVGGTITPWQATNKQILWKVEPAGIVSLSHTSSASDVMIVVTALKEGTATITGTTWEGNHSDTCVVTVESPAPPPPAGFSVTVSPDKISAASGDATFTATASGGTAPYTYRWSHEGWPLQATSAVLTIGVTQYTAGEYTCTVTDAAGATASASGTLEIGGKGTISIRTLSVGDSSCQLEVSVVDAQGQPVSGHSVQVTVTAPSYSRTESGRTGGDGKFTVEFLSLPQDATYTATASSSQYGTASCTFRTGKGSSLCEGGKILGIDDESSKPGGRGTGSAVKAAIVVLTFVGLGLVRFPRPRRRGA